MISPFSKNNLEGLGFLPKLIFEESSVSDNYYIEGN